MSLRARAQLSSLSFGHGHLLWNIVAILSPKLGEGRDGVTHDKNLGCSLQEKDRNWHKMSY